LLILLPQDVIELRQRKWASREVVASSMNSWAHHYTISPLALRQIPREYAVTELHLTLIAGLEYWNYNSRGYLEEPGVGERNYGLGWAKVISALLACLCFTGDT